MTGDSMRAGGDRILNRRVMIGLSKQDTAKALESSKTTLGVATTATSVSRKSYALLFAKAIIAGKKCVRM